MTRRTPSVLRPVALPSVSTVRWKDGRMSLTNLRGLSLPLADLVQCQIMFCLARTLQRQRRAHTEDLEGGIDKRGRHGCWGRAVMAGVVE